MTPTLQELPGLLRRAGILLRLSGAADFKAMAYDKAAQVVEEAGESLRFRDSEESLRELPNIGSSLAKEILAYLQTGRLPVLEALAKEVPADLPQWLDLSGMGAKRARLIHAELGISSMDDLRAALSDGRVAAIKTIGKANAAKLLEAMDWQAEHAGRCLLPEADALAVRVREYLSDAGRVEIAGSLRRGLETIGDIDLLVEAEGEAAAAVHARFLALPGIVEVLAGGESKSSVRMDEGRQVDLRTVPAASFATAHIYFTGSKEHNVFLRGRAKDKGLTLNEYGLGSLPCAEEADVYRHLDLPFVPPELREATYEAWITEGRLPERLIEATDLRGILHAHSTWSDGRHGLAEMAEACRARGYGYLGITDHSQSAAYAGGLSPERVRAQWEEIDGLNQRYRDEGVGFVIFKGIESDILADGRLDYPDDLLAGFDFVIASLHAQLDQPAERMQARVEAALRHPATTFLGHATGRLLLRREGAKLDLERVIRLAAAEGVGIEFNCTPLRMELDWRRGPLIRETGVWMGLFPDAHAVEELDNVHAGARVARKAGLPPSQVINTLSAEALRGHFEQRRARGGPKQP